MDTDDYNALAQPMSKNGWSSYLIMDIGMDDFLSLDEDDALKPWAIDGSMPRRFGRLAADSPLIDAGSDEHDLPADLVADFPFLRRTVTGKARDIGPYERPASISGVAAVTVRQPQSPVVRKVLRRGRLVIEKGPRCYNALGQEQ